MSNTPSTSESATDRSEQPPTPPNRRSGTSRLELSLYLIAAIAYIAVGFAWKEVFAWWSYGAVWLVGVIWFVPPLVRRLLNRVRPQTQPERDAD